MSLQELVPIILILFSVLFGTYYSQNYASIIYKGIVLAWKPLWIHHWLCTYAVTPTHSRSICIHCPIASGHFSRHKFHFIRSDHQRIEQSLSLGFCWHSIVLHYDLVTILSISQQEASQISMHSTLIYTLVYWGWSAHMQNTALTFIPVTALYSLAEYNLLSVHINNAFLLPL